MFSPHHSISSVSLYSLREAIADIIDQGLEIFRDRHTDNAERLQEGLVNIGLELFVESPENRLPTITAVRIPHGVNWPKVSAYLEERYKIQRTKTQSPGTYSHFVLSLHFSDMAWN